MRTFRPIVPVSPTAIAAANRQSPSTWTVGAVVQFVRLLAIVLTVLAASQSLAHAFEADTDTHHDRDCGWCLTSVRGHGDDAEEGEDTPNLDDSNDGDKPSPASGEVADGLAILTLGNTPAHHQTLTRNVFGHLNDQTLRPATSTSITARGPPLGH